MNKLLIFSIVFISVLFRYATSPARAYAFTTNTAISQVADDDVDVDTESESEDSESEDDNSNDSSSDDSSDDSDSDSSDDSEDQEEEDQTDEEDEYSGTDNFNGTDYNDSIPYFNNSGLWIFYYLVLFNSDHQRYYECFDQNHNQINCNRSTVKTTTHNGTKYSISKPYKNTSGKTVAFYITRYNSKSGKQYYECFSSTYSRIVCNRKTS